MADHDAWIVLSHGKLETLAENLWWVWGAIPNMSLKRSMMVARRSDGGLVLHNAIALDDEGMLALDALGEVAVIVVPNAMHRLDASAFAKRYPRAKVLAPSGSRDDAAKKVRVDGAYEDFPADADVQLEPLQGVANAEGVMRVTSRDGVTLVLNDAVFNMDRKRDPLGFLFTTVLGSAPGPRVSRLAKLLLVKDKKAMRADLERLADTPNLVRLAVAHEKVAHGADAAAALRQAATYL